MFVFCLVCFEICWIVVRWISVKQFLLIVWSFSVNKWFILIHWLLWKHKVVSLCVETHKTRNKRCVVVQQQIYFVLQNRHGLHWLHSHLVNEKVWRMILISQFINKLTAAKSMITSCLPKFCHEKSTKLFYRNSAVLYWLCIFFQGGVIWMWLQ